MTCYSLATCTYQALNLVSTTSLNMAGCRIFQQNSKFSRVTKPILISVVSKLLSFIPYYTSKDVQKDFGHPISGTAYPGVFSIINGYLSKRVSEKIPTIPQDALTIVSSTTTSFVHSFLQQNHVSKSFCNPLEQYAPSLANKTVSYPMKFAQFLAKSPLKDLEGISKMALFTFGNFAVFSSMDKSSTGSSIINAALLSVPLLSTTRKLMRLFGPPELKLYTNSPSFSPIDCHTFLGMAFVALPHLTLKKLPWQIHTIISFSLFVTLNAAQVYPIFACERNCPLPPWDKHNSSLMTNQTFIPKC